MNKNGKEIISPEYDRINCLSDNFFTYKLKNKWGIMNYKREIILEPKYERINCFESDSIASVYLDKNGGLLINPVRS